jgi:hypothetical protein
MQGEAVKRFVVRCLETYGARKDVMEPKTIEGTWEEVTRRAQELAGHRVRVTVLDELSAPAIHGNGKAIPESLIDHDAIAYCEREADDAITLEEVRAATSSIKDSMARVVIEEERAERF